MFKFLKKKDKTTNNSHLILKTAALLIHTAKIDEDFSKQEEEIIKQALLKLSTNKQNINEIIDKAKIIEENANQILDFTKEVKNMEEVDKEKIIEALWTVVYSDGNSDMYEENLMRRLTGLLYLNKKKVGDIKERVKEKLNK